ncbi:MAG: cytochrome c oxidase subunit 2 [Oceanicoccus sp.]|jgi:cytochrome c oxidase subunit 2
MALAIILILLIIGSLFFNFVNPWQATPIASNWGSIDDTIFITAIITGIFFVGITLFVAYVLIRYRHKENNKPGEHQAAYEPDNKRLEWWLTGITTVGICALLAPGLMVYNDFVHVPKEATVLEVVARQWMWSFRLPGNDNVLGKSSVGHIGPDNSYGIDPDDPNGQDDILIMSNEIHIQLDQPVKFLLRSLDVLHNFYVPQFRAKMDMVPGQLSYFWMTPIHTGEYEILCAEYCGVAHYNMRGHVTVDDRDDYARWLADQPTFAQHYQKNLTTNLVDGIEEQGRQLAENNGCFACHSIDGSKSLGPGWKNLFGKTEKLTDGSAITVDEPYFRESILNPSLKIVEGYPPVMAPYQFSAEQLDALIAYINSIEQ